MRSNSRFLVAGVLTGALGLTFGESTARAQVPPFAERDDNWDAVSTVSMVVGISTVALMPRVYYSSPDATVGWKARWHVSVLAPVMTMTALTWLVDQPISNAIESPRDGCTLDQTLAQIDDSGCEKFGSPSTHAFASWSATGAGLGIFLVDTLKYSDSEFHVGSFIGNVAVPLTASILTSVSRSADGSGIGPESTGQVMLAGAIPGFLSGALVGLTYSLLQEPDCGYGGSLFCW